MEKKIFLIILFSSTFFMACKTEKPHTNIKPMQSVNWIENGDTSQAFVVARPITYDVIVRAHNYDDDWTHKCLDSTMMDAFSNQIFEAIYSGKLIPYNSFTDEKMSLREVRKIDKEFARKRIGKMQFIENWYFDSNKMEFHKEVKGIMLAYERYRADSTVRNYKAGIKVFFDKKKNE